MGESSIGIRRNNKKKIFYLLYHEGEMTRRDISLRLNLSLTTVASITQEFLEEGLLASNGYQESSGGRKPVTLSLIADSKIACGIRISKHHVRLVLMNLSQKVVDKYSCRLSFEDTLVYWSKVYSLAQELLERNGTDYEKFLGYGMACPGLVDNADSCIDFAPTLGAAAIPFDQIRETFHGQLLIGNDADLAGRAEQWFRMIDKTCIYLMLSSGVGGTIIMGDGDKNPLGKRACEFGHIVIDRNGRQCACGRRGCLEQYCSSQVITEQSGMQVEDFFLEVDKGNGRCIKVLDTYLDDLALALDNLKNAYDVPVIIGGEMSKYLTPYKHRLMDEIGERLHHKLRENMLQMSNYSEFDGAIGAALMNIEAYLDR